VRLPDERFDIAYENDGETYTDVQRTTASPASVAYVTGLDPDLSDGETRSQWVWIRFPNGDLVLATYPQDEGYFAVVDWDRETELELKDQP